MADHEERRNAVNAAVARIRDILQHGVDIESLSRAKVELIALASRTDLFTFDEFPLPEDDAMECSYLIHEFDDGSYSLYVNSGAPHQYYAPHDHGNAWAIIAGVRGKEAHRMYLKREAFATGESPIEFKAEVIVGQGQAVTMQADGIHEVNALDGKPLLHLHLYANNFVQQGERWKYDLEQNLAEPFYLDELGSITDAR